MKKTFALLAFFFVLVLAAQAQTKQPSAPEPVDPSKDTLVYNGCTIRLLPAMGTGYGYDIGKEGRLLVSQQGNRFSASPNGLQKKEDVYKLARRQVGRFSAQANDVTMFPATRPKAQRRLPADAFRHRENERQRLPHFSRPLPQTLARELGIDPSEFPHH